MWKYCLRKGFTPLCYGMQFLLYSLVSIFSFPLHLIFSHENGLFIWGTFYIRSNIFSILKYSIPFENLLFLCSYFLVWLSSSDSKKPPFLVHRHKSQLFLARIHYLCKIPISRTFAVQILPQGPPDIECHLKPN